MYLHVFFSGRNACFSVASPWFQRTRRTLLRPVFLNPDSSSSAVHQAKHVFNLAFPKQTEINGCFVIEYPASVRLAQLLECHMQAVLTLKFLKWLTRVCYLNRLHLPITRRASPTDPLHKMTHMLVKIVIQNYICTYLKDSNFKINSLSIENW